MVEVRAMQKKVLYLLVSAGVLLSAGSALALDMEYYTYGGFNPIVQAFIRIALIFSDASYQGLIFGSSSFGVDLMYKGIKSTPNDEI